MRFLLSFLLIFLLAPLSSYASLNNENNPHQLVIVVGSPGADATVLAGLPIGKKMVVTSAQIVNAATIAASDTDFAQISFSKGPVAGPTIVAELDTRAAHESGLVANIAKAMNLVPAATTISSGDLLSVLYDETDAGTNIALTGAIVVVNYQIK